MNVTAPHRPIHAHYYRPRSDGRFAQSSAWVEELPSWDDGFRQLPGTDGRPWLENSQSPRLQIPLDFEVQHLRRQRDRVFVAGRKELLALDSSGQMVARRELKEPANALLVDQQGRLLVATPSAVEILTPELKTVHRLETGFRARSLMLLEDDSVVAAGRPERGERQLRIYDPQGELRFQSQGVDDGSVKSDGRRVYYLEGFLRGTTRMYDNGEGRDHFLSTSIQAGGLHPLGDGDFLSYEREPFGNRNQLAVHRRQGSDSSFKLGYREELKAGFVDDHQNIYALAGDADRTRLYRLSSEPKPLNPWTAMWTMNPWVGESMETVFDSDQRFDAVVFRGGGYAILQREGARLMRGDQEWDFDSVQELVNQRPDLLEEPVAGDVLGRRRRVENQTLADYLSYWASQRNLSLELPQPATAVVEADRLPQLRAGTLDDEFRFQDGRAVRATGEGEILLQCGQLDHRLRMGKEAVVGSRLQDGNLWLLGSEGGLLQIDAGLRALPTPDLEHLENGLRVGDFHLDTL